MSGPIPDITGLVLAGGLGRRMGGVDKGLQTWQGAPLVQHAMQRLRPQVSTLMLNANRNLDDYRAFGVPVWPDAVADFGGPLAGFLAGLDHCSTPLLLTVPCDAPLFPTDLAQRLAQALVTADADLALACAPDATGELRPQPVFCLMRVQLRDSLRSYFEAGGRKVETWAAQQRLVQVAFDQPGEDPQAFANLNTLEELKALTKSEAKLPQ